MPLNIHPSRRLVIALLLGVGVLAGFGAPRADAALSACRSDPQVYVTNGTNAYKVTVSANLPNDYNYGDIKHIDYQLHIPTGMWVTSVHYTSGISSVESLTVTADQPAHAYRDTTTVVTYSSPQTVQDTLQVVLQTTANGGGSSSGMVTGLNGQALTTSTTL